MGKTFKHNGNTILVSETTSDVTDRYSAISASDIDSQFSKTLLSGKVKLHYAADDLATLTKDGSNVVTSWTNKIDGHVVTQGTASARPVWVASVSEGNGKPGLFFDGRIANQYLLSSTDWLYLDSARSPFYMVCASASVGTHGGVNNQQTSMWYGNTAASNRYWSLNYHDNALTVTMVERMTTITNTATEGIAYPRGQAAAFGILVGRIGEASYFVNGNQFTHPAYGNAGQIKRASVLSGESRIAFGMTRRSGPLYPLVGYVFEALIIEKPSYEDIVSTNRYLSYKYRGDLSKITLGELPPP